MKRLTLFLFAAAIAASLAFIGKVNASAKKFPQCTFAPDDLCLTGPGGTTILTDFRNK